MADVFISYKQEEREAVQIIASALADLKLDVWFDTKLRAGGSFDEEIADALKEAKSILVCWTPAAVKSEWVRGEATEAHNSNRLVACFLQPAALIPPFNLTHAENLSAWAGQQDDPAWLKLLERIGELIDRPGLATFHAVMRPDATAQELKAWANAHGSDALVDTVWARIALLEGEDARERLLREKEEARQADERRRALREKSRRLIRERGLRDPVQERRRFMLLIGAMVAIVFLGIGATAYLVDAQARDRTLRDEVSTPEQARAFLARNAWHPIAGRAREKLNRLDTDAWYRAQSSGSIEALEAYVADSGNAPQGLFLDEARQALNEARRVHVVQERLRRIRYYGGPVDGSLNAETREAVRRFRYRWNLPVNEAIDDQLMIQLDAAIRWWTRPRLEELRATTFGAPDESDIRRIAEILGTDAATLMAIVDVFTMNPVASNAGLPDFTHSRPAFGADGRPIILFEGHIFSRNTLGFFDERHPNIAYRNWDPRRYPHDQDARWLQLAEAYSLDPGVALESTSWGKFQVLGSQFRSAGFETPGEFVRFISESEANQLEAAIVGLLRQRRLVDELQRHDWRGLARGYFGPGGVERYASLFEAAYRRQVDRLTDNVRPAEVADRSTEAIYRYARGQGSFEIGDFEFAIAEFDAALAIAPSNPGYLAARCEARAAFGQLELALSDCNASLAMVPSAAAFSARGLAQLKRGAFSEALADYERALSLDRTNVVALFGRGLSRLRMNQAVEGEVDIRAANAADPNLRDAFESYGLTLPSSISLPRP